MPLPDSGGLSTRTLTLLPDILAARQLQGEIYLQAGLVAELDEHGTVPDKWVSESTYFGVELANHGLVAVSRLIRSSDPKGLPVATCVQLDQPGKEWLEGAEPSEVMEVSALAVRPNRADGPVIDMVELLASRMTAYSLMHGSRFLVAILDPLILRRLHERNVLAFEPIGPVQEMTGSPVRPVRLDIYPQVRSFHKRDPEGCNRFLRHLPLETRARVLAARGQRRLTEP